MGGGKIVTFNPLPMSDTCPRTTTTKNRYNWAGALVKWLWEETHIMKVVGSNPSTMYRIDIFTYICCKYCNVYLQKTENKQF